MIKIITDSSADLPEAVIEKYDITVVPMRITIGNHDYFEKIDLSPKEFFKKMVSTNVLPKTSQPSPASFAEAFSKFDKGTVFFEYPAAELILLLTLLNPIWY